MRRIHGGALSPDRSNGFTLIELLVTVAVVAILAGIVLPVSEVTRVRAKEHELRRALNEIRDALDAWRKAGDEGRIARAPDASGYPPTLDALIQGVEDARSPDRRPLYFLRRIPRDPFHPDASVPAQATWRIRSYLSPADDPQPGADVFDVASSSDRVGLNGVPYREW